VTKCIHPLISRSLSPPAQGKYITLLLLYINISAKKSSRSDWGSNPRPTATPPGTKYQCSNPLSQIVILKMNGSLDSAIQAWDLSTRHVANSGELLYTQCFYGSVALHWTSKLFRVGEAYSPPAQGEYIIHYIIYYILIYLRRKVPGQTGARTRDLRQHRLTLNTNALTLWARSPFLKRMVLWTVAFRHMTRFGNELQPWTSRCIYTLDTIKHT
jgi:hypothetical protein